MKLTVLEVTQGTDFNGEVNYTMIVLGKFKEFKTIVPASQKIDLTHEDYIKYKDSIGKVLDLDIIVPVSKYPFSLAS